MVDVSASLPGLKYAPGLSKWRVRAELCGANKENDLVFFFCGLNLHFCILHDIVFYMCGV